MISHTLIFFYHPTTKMWEGHVFIVVCWCSQGVGWGCMAYAWPQVPSREVGMSCPRSLLGVPMPCPRSLWGTPPARYTPLGKVHCLGTPTRKVHPPEGTTRYWHLVVATEAVGTHPTGMHSCYFNVTYLCLAVCCRIWRRWLCWP